MNITRSEQDGKLTLCIDGWLDTMASPELGKEIDSVSGVKELVLDFDKVEYMASAGLRQVVYAHRKAKEIGASFSVVNVASGVMSIFKMTGIDRKLNIIAK